MRSDTPVAVSPTGTLSGSAACGPVQACVRACAGGDCRETFPAASSATTVKVKTVAHASPVTAGDALLVVATVAPFASTRYATTRTLSVAATKLSCAVVEDTFRTRSAPGRDGGNRSFAGWRRSIRVFDQRDAILTRLRTFQYQAPRARVAAPLARCT